jgi:glycosyltransferase involved in cell wall biosynthesis
MAATYRRLNSYIKNTPTRPDGIWQLTAPQFHAVPTLLAAHRWRVPVATRIPGNKFDEYLKQSSIIRKGKTYFTNNFLLRLIRFSEAVVVLSEYNKRRVQELGIPKENIYLLRQPLDTDVFAPANEHRRENLRKELGFSSRKHNILYVGRISELKGMPTLDVITKDLDCDDYEFHLVGDGPYRSTFEDRENVICHGFVDPEELHLYYKISDLYLHPSHTEEQGISWTMIEAAATRIPVVARNIGNASKVATFAFSDTGELLSYLRDPSSWTPAPYPVNWSLNHLEPKYNTFFSEFTGDNDATTDVL